MQREADKKKEYAERTKVDVRDILNDSKTQSILAADRAESDDRKAPANPRLLESKD